MSDKSSTITYTLVNYLKYHSITPKAEYITIGKLPPMDGIDEATHIYIKHTKSVDLSLPQDTSPPSFQRHIG